MKNTILTACCLSVWIVLFGSPSSSHSQSPVPDVKVNGSDAPVVIVQPDSMRVSVALDNDGMTNPADWWFVAATPFGPLFLTPDGWTAEIRPAYQGPLFPIPLIDLMNIPVSGFPPGVYTLYIGVDTQMDGAISLESLSFDGVEVALTVDAEKTEDTAPAILGPLFMYYLDRYFSEIADESEIGSGLAAMLDAAPESHAFLMRILNTYKELPEETRNLIFDANMVEMTSSSYEEIDLEMVNDRLEATTPLTASLLTPDISVTVPKAPTNLSAQNFSAYDEEFPSHAVKLTWQDNSDEDGFALYCAFKSEGASAHGAFTEIARVSSNVTEYIDTLVPPTNQGDQYCYQVLAYTVSPIALVGQTPEQLKSSPSNTACSLYSVTAPSSGPDSDFDGVPDADDYCPTDSGITGLNLGVLGCPDSDNDGVADTSGDKDKDGIPDLTLDQCPGVQGEYLGVSDKGPHPQPGCPLKYKLVWMGMEILNNSHPNVYGEAGDQFDEKDEFGNVTSAGEEPYLLFSFVNGQDVLGDLHAWAKRWCCGERVDLSSHGKEFEPDKDLDGETSTDFAYLGSLLNDTFTGITLFGEGEDFAVIDSKTDLAMGVTLMERDWTNEQCFSDYVSEWEIAVKAGALVGKVAGGCTGGGVFGCGVALVQGIVSFVKDMFALDKDPICVEVPDPDDYMGVNGWSISRADAKLKTSGKGAYAFWFDMPTSVTKTCVPTIPYQTCTLTTMRARLSFCLYREGIQASDIKKVCSPITQAVWPAVQ